MVNDSSSIWPCVCFQPECDRCYPAIIQLPIEANTIMSSELANQPTAATVATVSATTTNPSTGLAIAKPSNSLRPAGIAITSVNDLTTLAVMMYKGGCMPKNIDRPEKLATVIMAGLDVGLSPTQAVGSIAIIDGKPSIYGDGAMALVRSSGLLERLEESVAGDGDSRAAICKVTRRGEHERVYQFSMADAKRAGLIERAYGRDGKPYGPWATYPDRMLMMRARGFAFRDVFADVLRGLHSAEEVQDLLVMDSPSPATGAIAVASVPVTVAVAESVPVPVPVQDAVAEPVAAPVTVATTSVPAVAHVVPTAPVVVASPDATDTTRPGSITDTQRAELKRLFGLAVTAKKLQDPPQVILGYLSKYSAPNAAALTAQQADDLIATLIKEHDPFTQLPGSPAP